MNIHKKDDAFLWNKLKGGCTTALGNLYDLYIEELFSYGIKIHQNREFVKDCIHDLFLDLYKYHNNLAKTDNVKYYLLLSLKRKIIKNIQLNKTHLPEIDILNTYNQEFYIGSIEEELIKEESFAEQDLKLTKALDLLSKTQKQGLYLRFNKNKSYEEIAKTMNITVQTSRTTIYRGIKSLRKKLTLLSIIISSIPL
ncbi:RNA polymerase sigma factor [Albibacterium bauzanense]|uniref:RNA polymerase sigma-70 factor (ECF subfamily) n=1 Tax=Albibacterium bauzanense TaxID=653929 RepID=A0A4R1LR47_9SPHI|nr:sigma-70 family RNA polymerase sigma factor [Albibacterium bauzanense]TCK80784.1 RNA polymerase sigma-70 factor (ECF subfamily) [Albibacterium bauzanense]